MRLKSYSSIFIFGILILCSCSDSTNYKEDLLSDNKHKIIKACYELGELRDVTSIKNLLNKALDPRISHDIKFKGMTVNYCRLKALQKITNNAYSGKIKQHEIDTIATFYFRDWAIKNEYLKSEKEVNVNYLN